MQKYAIVEKAVGQTPLQAIEQYRDNHPELQQQIAAEDFGMQVPLLEAVRRRSRIWLYGEKTNPPKQQMQKYQPIPLAYAGRLDPMASGKLLILIGEECKQQEKYHGLDKAYTFSVLFGVGSDTQDILGRLTMKKPIHPTQPALAKISQSLLGNISLPYPHFSSKTVRGKPLHVWTLEDRLDEIEIPMAESHIYQLRCTRLVTKSTEAIYKETLAKINSIPPVTEASKALGADFRRHDVRADWRLWQEMFPKADWSIATFDCVCSSGTYMRSLAALIGSQLNTEALAYSIDRTAIGRYQPLPILGGWWRQNYR